MFRLAVDYIVVFRLGDMASGCALCTYHWKTPGEKRRVFGLREPKFVKDQEKRKEMQELVSFTRKQRLDKENFDMMLHKKK